MRVCVTATAPQLDAEVDPRFGRCRFFLFVDPETMEFEAVENPNVQAAGGAGIQSAQLVANRGVQAVITGNVGPNAFSVLQAAGVRVITGASGTVRRVVEEYRAGRARATPGPTVGAHHGVSAPPSGATPPGLEELRREVAELRERLDRIVDRLDRLAGSPEASGRLTGISDVLRRRGR